VTSFLASVDIANRACQHMGVPRITALIPPDDTVQASELAFAYDKVRRAEMRRNVWRFAVRKTVLRPVDTTTQSFVPDAWDVGTTYAAGAIVSYGDTIWSSTIGTNLANTPGTTGWQVYFGTLLVEPFSVGTVYYAGDLASVTTTAYISLISSNTDTPPTTNWLAVSGTLSPFSLLYPIGSGPSSQTATRNVYQLPNGYLREAPQDPKAGSTSFLGAPSGRMYDDWTFEGNYFTSRQSQPIVFRFVADVEDVTLMDDMFCEGLGCSLALACVERTTQSVSKFGAIAKDYGRIMGEARTVNGIETGPTEPPEDDYITARI
jgi:hypothetical protein